MSEAKWREMTEVHLNSGFLMAQALGNHMREKNVKGRILFITSLHAESPRNLPHYSASKAGQTMLMKEFARALGPYGIRVNALVPGAFPGQGFKGLPGMEDKIPLKRLGTGASVVVDGGIALHNWIDPAT